MIELRFAENCRPKYMTRLSSACDLVAREPAFVEPFSVAKVPVGVWIEAVDDNIDQNVIPELQIRARSGLAYKSAIMLANGVGTIDADYRDEICVLLYNGGKERFTIEKGMRIAQMTLGFTNRIASIPIGEERSGGFGSTLV